MKRIYRMCIALLVALCSTAALHAQSFSYGITAGLNLTKLHLSGSAKGMPDANLSSDNKAGWFVGPKVEFNTLIGLGVDAALEYSERDLNISTGVGSQNKKYRTFEIPINVRYNVGLGKMAGIYVSTGPQFGFALQNMNWDKLVEGGNFSRSNMNTTWNVGAGVRLLGHLEVGVGYNFALGKVGEMLVPAGDSKDYELEYKSNTFQVQLTYLF